MKSPKETPARLHPWVDPVWSATTPEAREEQLQRLARAQARGSLLLRIARGADVRAELAKMAARTEVMEREVAEAWVSAVLVEGAGERRSLRLGTVVLVLAVVCVVALAALGLR